MKKFFSLFILSFFLCVFSLNLQVYYNIEPFSSSRVKENINYLSSDYFKGRLPGTIENLEAMEYVKSSFINNGLKPYQNSYNQYYSVKYPKRIAGSPYLIIKNKNGKEIKSYIYGKDFKEDMLNFKQNKVSLSLKDHIVGNPNTLQIKNSLGNILFYSMPNDNLDFRSSFVYNSSFDLCIITTSKALDSIKSYVNNGYTINCFIPYKVADTSVSNVFGYIEGYDKSLPPIILSAHFDHIGTDLKGDIYNGALDNASGMSFVLELSKYISSLGKPQRDIIFVGFNCEEFGCIGSNMFAKKYSKYIKDSKVYNFDMIGSNNSVPLCIMGGEKDTNKTPFLNSVSSTCSGEKIYFNYLFEDASDHMYFRKHNISAVTLCDNDISKIHTSKDKSKYISSDGINRCFKVMSKEIIKNAYNNNVFFLYSKELCFISLIVILAAFTINYKKS